MKRTNAESTYGDTQEARLMIKIVTGIAIGLVLATAFPDLATNAWAAWQHFLIMLGIQ